MHSGMKEPEKGGKFGHLNRKAETRNQLRFMVEGKVLKHITIISTGQELVSGRSVDRNASFLSRTLAENGFRTRKLCILGDEPEVVAHELKASAVESDAVIVTGGLGPTFDDRTRGAIADAARVELEKNGEIMHDISAMLERRGVNLTDGHVRQALFPRGAVIFKNQLGTAFGFSCKVEGTPVIAMPGVPEEMRAMFKERVLPFIKSQGFRAGSDGEVMVCERVNVFGLPESGLNSLISDMIHRGRNPELGICVDRDCLSVSVAARASTPQLAEGLLESDLSELQNRLGSSIYGFGNMSLAEATFKLLKRHGLKIAVAESCTGGLVGDKLVDLPGISEVFLLDLVAYDNKMKKDLLGVSAENLDSHGAVSAEVAQAMAVGVRAVSGAEAGVSTTGIAGPSGGSTGKPVGLVYIGLDIGGEKRCFKHNLSGNRRQIRERAAGLALNYVRLMLKGTMNANNFTVSGG